MRRSKKVLLSCSLAILLPGGVLAERDPRQTYGGIYVDEQSQNPNLHIESPIGGAVLLDGVDVLNLIHLVRATIVAHFLSP